MKYPQISSSKNKGIRFKKLIINSFIKKNKNIKTLINEFKYPRKGPVCLGVCRDQIIKSGKKIFMNANAYEYQYLEDEKFWRVKCKIDNENYEIDCKQIINSAPLKVVNNITPVLKNKSKQNHLTIEIL